MSRRPGHNSKGAVGNIRIIGGGIRNVRACANAKRRRRIYRKMTKPTPEDCELMRKRIWGEADK